MADSASLITPLVPTRRSQRKRKENPNHGCGEGMIVEIKQTFRKGSNCDAYISSVVRSANQAHTPNRRTGKATGAFCSKKEKARGDKFNSCLKEVRTHEKVRDLHKGTPAQRAVNVNHAADLLWSLFAFVFFRRVVETRAQALIDAVIVLAERLPLVFESPLDKLCNWHTSRKFRAWKIQRTIDIHATGGLNYRSLNLLRVGVEELGKYNRGIIPHGTTVALRARELEKHGEQQLGLTFTTSNEGGGTFYCFDFDNLLRLILQRTGLALHAREGSTCMPVQVAFTIDGAALTNHLGHVTCGLKIVDPRAMDPRTGVSMAMSGIYQSRKWCFPIAMYLGSETKESIKNVFGPIFKRFAKGKLLMPATESSPPLTNFEVSVPADQSAGWKLIQSGSTKQCPYCNHDKCNWGKGKCGDDRCDLCKKLSCQKCWCLPVCDQAHLDGANEAL